MIDISQVHPEREIQVSRLIEGPRPLVFEVFTTAAHVSRWWGPNGFTTTSHSFDFREGGEWDFIMHGPDGVDYPNWIKWLEIQVPERMLLLHGTHKDDPDAFTAIVTFSERPGGTEVTIRNIFRTKERRDEVVEKFGAVEGAKQHLARLGDYTARVARVLSP